MNGNFNWANKVEIETKKNLTYYSFLSKFDPSGKNLWTKIFEEMEQSVNKPIEVDDLGNIYISGSFSSCIALNMNSKKYYTIDIMISDNEKSTATNYNSKVDGLAEILNLLKNNDGIINGAIVQKSINKSIPDLKSNSPELYNNIAKLYFQKNAAGITNIVTENGSDINFNVLQIKNNSKIKVSKYKSGNYQVDVLSGFTMGKAYNTYVLNFIKLVKNNGDLLFDFDTDHSQKKYNLIKSGWK